MSETAIGRASLRFNWSSNPLLSEEKRYEILQGNLYLVAPPGTNHQKISLNLASAILRYVRESNLGVVLAAPYNVVLSEQNILQPDILYVRKERAGIIGRLNLRGAPDLVIEILSEGNWRKDLELKNRIYAGFGVAEFWVVDPASSTIILMFWSELGYVMARRLRKTDKLSSPLLPALDLPLPDIFQPL